MPRVPGGGGHLEDVLVEGAARLVHRQGGQALHLRLGRDHRDPDALVALGGLGGGPGGADRVRVVREHDHLLRAGGVDGVEDHAGRRAVARPADDDRRAGFSEQLLQPGPRGDGDDLAAAARGTPRPGLGDLLGEVGDLDAVRTARRDARLDRGADVVHVDVDVPQAVAADDDERVAEPAEVLLERRDLGVVGVEEVHHLVRRPVGRQGVGVPLHGDGDAVRPDRRGDGDRTAAGQRGLGRVEDDAEPATAGVDDARVAEDLEQLRRARECLASGRRPRR